MIAERREHPTDDLTSVLVHAEIDGQKLEEHEIVMGFFLLVAAGNDSTKATYCSGMRALMEHPEQRQALLEDPSLVPSAVEESLRMFPAFAHFRRTATCDTELAGQPIREGEKVVMWYVSSNRDETATRIPTASTCVETPSTRRSVPAGATSASARRWRGWSSGDARGDAGALSRGWSWPAGPRVVESGFINQLKTLPVRLAPRVRAAGGMSSRLPSAPLHRPRATRARLLLVGPDHVHDGIDQRQVRKRLGEVAQVAAGDRVDLLGVEPERAGVAEQPLAQPPRTVELTDLTQRRDQPERADEERPLPTSRPSSVSSTR